MSWNHFFKTVLVSAVLLLAGLALVLALLSALGVVNFDVYLRRYAASQGAGERAGSFTVSQGEDAAAATGETSLLMVGYGGAAVYGSNGALADGLSRSFELPTAHSAGNYSVAYDAGGSNVAVFSNSACLYELRSANTVISASVSEGGYMTLCSKEERYLGAVTVHSMDGEPVYKIYSAVGYPVAAQVAPDGERLAVLRISEDGSFVDIYDMHETESAAVFTAPGAIAADIAWLNDRRILLLGTQAVYIIDGQAEQVSCMELGDSTLLKWAFSDSFVSVVTSGGGFNAAQTLMTLDADGRIIASADFGGGIDCIDQCGKYLAVASGDDLIIYNKNLENCDAFTLEREAAKLWMRVDGTAAAISGGLVQIYG